jgi:hypothetical protein
MKLDRFLRPRWVLLGAVLGYGVFLGVQLGRSYVRAKGDVDRIRHVVASEELILALGEQLRGLSRSVENLMLPDDEAASIFVSPAETLVVAEASSPQPTPISATSSPSPSPSHIELESWHRLLSEVNYFEHAKFYIVDGHFADDSLDQFVTNVNFKGLARLGSGSWSGIQAKHRVVWRRSSPEPEAPWQITSWTAGNFTSSEVPTFLFREVLDQALPRANDLQQARVSAHETAVIDFYQDGGRRRPWRYFTPISANQRPGISVVDVDQDGFDDLYIAVRRGPNQLLRNRGDGTFEEVAHQWGVDIRDENSCSIFADFDNDGDPDLMLGRSFQRSMYLENVGDRFVARGESESSAVLPHLVVSMSAADFNQDGLLDVYFCTYRPAVLESIIADEQSEPNPESANERPTAPGLQGVARNAVGWPEEFLSPEDARRFARRTAQVAETDDQFGKILDQVGPPNVLLVNRGQGRFEVALESPQLATWRNSLQATWADFDEDGDPDLYVANDWAADQLFRNDRDRGFTDVTQDLGTTEFGFGMGVTWGDYDRDGLQDVYVSNMYSKAGRRITAQIKELNPAYGRSVDGNYLYRQTPDGFRLVSGLHPPQIPVAEAGWSWGGQFADFDNDGYLDLYVLSGYFTAPEQFASNVDL